MTVSEMQRTVAASSQAADRRETRTPQPMGREIGQSVYLMALMAAMLTVYVGLGLLAVRLFG